MKVKNPRKISLVVIIFSAMLAFAPFASADTTPKPGSKDRVGICDALRKDSFSKELKGGRYVEFVIDSLKIEGEWACFSGYARYRDTKKQEDMDYAITALFKRTKSGNWIAKNVHIHGDVPGMEEIFKNYPAPKSILPDYLLKLMKEG